MGNLVHAALPPRQQRRVISDDFGGDIAIRDNWHVLTHPGRCQEGSQQGGDAQHRADINLFQSICFFFPALSLCFAHPVYSCIVTALFLSPSRVNSAPGSLRRPFFPLRPTLRADIFIARRVQHFLPSLTRIELRPRTLLRALGG